MGQLVKLSDYVSRYEIDVYRYPSRYVRLKKERWERLKRDREAREKGKGKRQKLFFNEDVQEEETSIRRSWRELLGWKKIEIEEETEVPLTRNFKNQSLESLKKTFLDELFQFQMNWASSTVSEISYIKRSYYYDSFLQFLVKQLPDTFFIFYEPVFFLKKAPVDLDVLVVTPTEIWMIKPLLGNDQTIFQVETDRFWIRKTDKKIDRFLSPVFSLRRMRTVVESILVDKELKLPIKQVIVAKDSFLDISQSSQKVQLIDKRNFKDFHETLLKNSSPIKHTQLKVIEILLAQSLTIAESRTLSNDVPRNENNNP